MDEEFTTTANLNVQENLKLPTEDQVRLEEPFLVEKSQEDEPEKTNTESEVQSMVMVPIHQDTSFVPLMTTPVIDLTVSQPVSTTVQAPLPTSTATVTAIRTTTSLLPPPTQPQQGSSDLILMQRISELKQHMANLLQDNLALEERLDKHGSRLYKLKNLDIPHQVNKAVDEIVMDAIDWAIQAPLRDRFRDLPEARCHSQDLVFEAFDKRQMGEDAIMSPRDRVYRLLPRDPVNKSTPSKLRMKQVC
ncbi:hypothetical protein Tco_1449834 [Tanacetum coccineum]